VAAVIYDHAPNLLLAKLPRRESYQFLSLCEMFEMEAGTVLCEVDAPYTHAYFPTSGFISLDAGRGDQHPLEIALIGKEGMLGATLLLGIDTAPVRAIVRSPGIACRISAAKLKQQLWDSPMLRKTLSRNLYMQMVELSLLGGCIRYHRIEQRLARTLLLAHDRLEGESFYLTHGDLADMLGVRRSSITIAAGDLQDRKLISYTRGSITMLDRRGMEAMSCECYEVLQSRQGGSRQGH
jgi:CRP-like cAMP-binding protein